jgi:hypothetical protein
VDRSTEPFDAGEAGMLTLDQARERLASTEPLDDGTRFWTKDPGTQVIYGKGWAEAAMTEPAQAWLYLAGQEYQLTRQAARELGSTARIPQKLQEFVPNEKLSDLVTWALQEGLPESELKVLLSGSGLSEAGSAVPLAVAQTRAPLVPFSNLRLLDTVLLAVRAKLGHEAADSAVVDYKFFHDLEHTSLRVVLPVVQQVAGEDAWCYGIEVLNSLIGLKQTVVSGYLFRLSTTAGITDVEHTAGGFSRRGSSPEAVFGWAAESVTEILDGLESAFNGLRVLSARPLDGDYSPVLKQLFKERPVAKDLKLRVLADLEENPDELTMFSLAHAASAAANLDGSTWREVLSLHALAGHIVHQGGGMCDGSLPRGCRRLLDKDWAPPDEDA